MNEATTSKILKLKVELFRLELIESLSKINNYHFTESCTPYTQIYTDETPRIDIALTKLSNGIAFSELENFDLNCFDIETLIDIVDCVNIKK